MADNKQETMAEGEWGRRALVLAGRSVPRHLGHRPSLLCAVCMAELSLLLALRLSFEDRFGVTTMWHGSEFTHARHLPPKSGFFFKAFLLVFIFFVLRIQPKGI